MTHTYYPIALDVHDRRCLVVGGGSIAHDKVRGLLLAGANVVVVSPDVVAPLEELALQGRIALHRRSYRHYDLRDVYLVYGATDNLEVNAQVVAHGRAAGVLANAVDDIPNCDFFAMAITRLGDLQIAISTNGQSPAFARWLREYLDSAIPAEFEDLLAILADVRRETRGRGMSLPYDHWRAAITDEVLLLLRHGDRVGAQHRVHRALTDAAESAHSTSGDVPARWSEAV